MVKESEKISHRIIREKSYETISYAVF